MDAALHGWLEGNRTAFGPVVPPSSSTDPLPYGSTGAAVKGAREALCFDGTKGIPRGPPQEWHTLAGLVGGVGGILVMLRETGGQETSMLRCISELFYILQKENRP